MEEWKEYKLGDVCSRLKSGKGISSSSILKNAQYPVIGGNGIRGYVNTANFKGECAVIGRQGAYCGNVRYFNGEAYMTEHAVVAVGNSNVNTRYLACMLARMQLGNLSAQSAQPGLSVQILSKLLVKLPPLYLQNKIAAVVKSIDDKIELNRRINDNLEQQAQALFKSWFVDFEPWGGKMPSDWREYSLTEIANIFSGYSYKGAELQTSKDAMATIKNFDRKGNFKLDGYKEIIISGNYKKEQLLTLLDVIVAHTDLTQNAEIIGNPTMILSKGDYNNIIMSMDLCKVQPKISAISTAFIYCMLKTAQFKSHALGYVNGTTVLHLNKRALYDYKVFLPINLAAIKDMSDRLHNMFICCSNNVIENVKLAQLRDTLLPRLMSGELKIS